MAGKRPILAIALYTRVGSPRVKKFNRALIRKVRSLNSVHLMRDSFVLDLLMEAGKYRGVACNGVHGANRLASNSLKEKVIFEALPINQELGSQQSIDPVTIS